MLITHEKLVRASMLVDGCRGEEKGSKKEDSPPPRGDGGDTVDVTNSSFNSGKFSDKG